MSVHLVMIALRLGTLTARALDRRLPELIPRHFAVFHQRGQGPGPSSSCSRNWKLTRLSPPFFVLRHRGNATSPARRSLAYEQPPAAERRAKPHNTRCAKRSRHEARGTMRKYNNSAAQRHSAAAMGQMKFSGFIGIKQEERHFFFLGAMTAGGTREKAPACALQPGAWGFISPCHAA